MSCGQSFQLQAMLYYFEGFYLALTGLESMTLAKGSKNEIIISPGLKGHNYSQGKSF